MPRHVLAVLKAPRARLLADFARAARLIQSHNGSGVDQGRPGTVSGAAWVRGYVMGAMEFASLTQRAALLTAWGE